MRDTHWIKVCYLSQSIEKLSPAVFLASYTNSGIFKGKWVEWTESHANIIPSNFEPDIPTTYVAGNIDW